MLYEHLRVLGITWRTYAHRAVFTVAEADEVHGTIPGGHTKNLFLKDKKGGLWLAVVRDRLRVDLNSLAKQLGAPRFSFGSGALLLETLGVEPGSVTPFALINDAACAVRPVLDREMLSIDPLNFHPLRNDRTTAIAPADLLRFVKACGHDPIVAALPEVVE